MRVACIANSWIPSVYANSIQVMKMCGAIASLGHEVTLSIGTNEKEQIQLKEGDIFSSYGVERIFEIKKIPLRINSIHAFISSVYAKLKKTELCYTRSIYAASLIPRQRIITKRNGVDIERFNKLPTKEELRRGLNLPQDKRIICYAGSLYRGRGIELLLSVSRKLPIDLLMLIVGGRRGDLDRYKGMALNMGCTNVEFRGFVPNSTVPRYLVASDVLVMPYQSSAEDPSGRVQANYMCPMKMFEYMASGRPIVASDLGIIREVLRDRENAILFDPSDEVAFLNAIKIALEDRELAQRISRNAQEEVKKHTWAKRAQEIFSFL